MRPRAEPPGTSRGAGAAGWTARALLYSVERLSLLLRAVAIARRSVAAWRAPAGCGMRASGGIWKR